MEARYQGIGMTSVRTRKRLAERLRDRGIHNDAVLNAIVEMPRHMFVDEAMATRAYDYVVALMTQLLLESQSVDREAGSVPAKVLEIGTGSGYQAAILSTLVERVYTVERVRSLAHRCSAKFGSMGIRNISSRYRS